MSIIPSHKEELLLWKVYESEFSQEYEKKIFPRHFHDLWYKISLFQTELPLLDTISQILLNFLHIIVYFIDFKVSHSAITSNQIFS